MMQRHKQQQQQNFRIQNLWVMAGLVSVQIGFSFHLIDSINTLNTRKSLLRNRMTTKYVLKSYFRKRTSVPEQQTLRLHGRITKTVGI